MMMRVVRVEGPQVVVGSAPRRSLIPTTTITLLISMFYFSHVARICPY